MSRHVHCDLCGADEPRLFAERPPREDVLHSRFVRCGSCGLIYADPRCDADEAARHYGQIREYADYDVQALDASAWRRRVTGRRAHLEEALRVAGTRAKVGGRFLDPAFGDGSALAGAQELGYEAVGLEFNPVALAQVAERLPGAHLRQGDVAEAELPEGAFHLIYTWHTIEHVLDVNDWLRRLFALLAPKGVLVVGTESSNALQGKLWSLPFRLRGRTPWPPTSTDHTYWFSAPSLRKLVEHAGFEVPLVREYENRPRETVDPQAFRAGSWRARAAMGLYAVSAAASQLRPAWGGKLLLVARKAS